MHVPRAVSLSLLAALAIPWAAALSLAGFWLLSPIAADLWPSGWAVTLSAGFALLTAGQLVFLVCVADRFCPAAGRRIGPWLELPLCVALFASCLAAALFALVDLIQGAAG